MRIFSPDYIRKKMASITALNNSSSFYPKPLKSSANSSMVQPKTIIMKNSEIIEVNFRYTALMALCLGFLFIWSLVVSLTFIKHKVDENSFNQEPFEVFFDQERIGRIMFAIGQEMLFIVDSLVSIQLDLSDAQDLVKSVNFTWEMTDNDIEDVKSEIIKPTSDLIYLVAAIEAKLAMIRSNLSLTTDHPLTMINSYRMLFEISEQYSIEKTLYHQNRKMLGNSHWHLMKSFVEIQNAPYSLFIKGMNRRFIELAYGTIYHIGPQLINQSESDTEVSNYFYYFYSSHELIENAFAWDSRIYHQYLELLKSKHNRIMLTDSKINLYRFNKREYTRFVTDVVTYLMRAKDVLNGCFRELLFQVTVSMTNQTMFYVVISWIYLIVLIVCTTSFVLFVRNAKIKSDCQDSDLKLGSQRLESAPTTIRNISENVLYPTIAKPPNCISSTQFTL